MSSSGFQQFFKLRLAGLNLNRWGTLRERQRLLHLIHLTWIEGLLEPSLAITPYIPLHLQQWSSGEANQPDQESVTAVLPETSMLDIFDKADGQLLILGEPCAGKTTLLLKLLRDLLQRAEQDERSPLPVVLNLSSWAIESYPLEQWLAEELGTKYQMDSIWSTRSLLLLDGLDQLPENEREACLQAIDVYRKIHKQVQIAICCRYAEYRSLRILLSPHSVILIQPLTDEQIATNLDELHGQGEIVRHLLSADPILRTMIRWPLLLQLLIQIAEQTSPEELAATDPGQKLRALFAAYTQSQLAVANQRYSVPDQVRSLSWLAQRLSQEQQTEFRLEQLHPAWLPNAWWKCLYALLFGLIALPIACTFYTLRIENDGALTGNFIIDTAATWLVVALIFLVRTRRAGTGQTKFMRASWLWIGLGIFVLFLDRQPIGACIALAVGIAFWLFCGWINQLYDKRFPAHPEQMIHILSRHATTSGLLSLLFLSLLGWLIPGAGGLFSGLHFGTLFGLAIGLGFGADAVIQHFILRFILWRAHCLPWRAQTFLDHAVERQILNRTGNGYTFRHQLFSDYFAYGKDN